MKYISEEQTDYILNLFDNINDNLHQEYFQNFSKQIIFILINTEYKSFVINYVKHININTITSTNRTRNDTNTTITTTTILAGITIAAIATIA